MVPVGVQTPNLLVRSQMLYLLTCDKDINEPRNIRCHDQDSPKLKTKARFLDDSPSFQENAKSQLVHYLDLDI